jgi:hypothetical protein
MGHEAAREAGSYRDKSQPDGASRRWLWPVLALLLLGGLFWGFTRTITPSSSTDVAKVAAMPKPAAVVEQKAEAVQSKTVAIVPMAEVGPKASDAATPAARLEDAPEIKKVDEARQAAADASNGMVGAAATASLASKKTPVRGKPAVAANNAEVTRAAQRIITAREVQRVQEVARQSPAERSSGVLDSDVELVSALISHGADVGSNTQTAATAPPPTIASLVQQCRALDVTEAAACRKRICAGYWGKAQACPVSERTTSAR